MSTPAHGRRRLAAARRWALVRHRPLEALLCAACLVAGAAAVRGPGWALIVLGGLLAIDLAGDVVTAAIAAYAMRRPRR